MLLKPRAHVKAEPVSVKSVHADAIARVGMIATAALPGVCAAQSLLPTPTGRHAVGRETVVLNDTARPEAFTTDAADTRRISVRFWYPADGGTPGNPGVPLTLTSDDQRLAEFAAASDPSISVEDALVVLQALSPSARGGLPFAAAASPAPVVLLSPGLGSLPEEYTSIAEDLASHGYFVAGVNHTYISGVNIDLPDAPASPVASTGREQDNAANVTCAEDLLFTLNIIEQLDADPASLFYTHIDTSRVAAVGHSFGGSASVNAALADARVDCAVNMDGSIFGPAVFTPPDRPVMLLQAEGTDFVSLPPETLSPEELAALGITAEEWAAERAFIIASHAAVTGLPSAGGAGIVIAGATHHSFSDFALIGLLDGGSIDLSRFRTIATAYLRAFLAEQLSGERQFVLRQPSDLYPDAALTQPAPGCIADFNGDGRNADEFDILDFLAALDAGIDFNADAVDADIFDLFDFLAALESPCR